MHQRTLDLLARRKRYDSGDDGAATAATGIEHARLEFDGRKLRGDGSQSARGRMTILATARPIEIDLAHLEITSKQFLHWIRFRDAARLQRFRGARMQKRRDVGHLFVGHRHRRHAFIRTPKTNDFADLVALHVMSHERRADKVRPSSACGIRAVTESTGLLELFASALDCRVLRNSLWPSRGIPKTKGQKYRSPSNSSFGRLSSPCKLILMHLHSSLFSQLPGVSGAFSHAAANSPNRIGRRLVDFHPPAPDRQTCF